MNSDNRDVIIYETGIQKEAKLLLGRDLSNEEYMELMDYWFFAITNFTQKGIRYVADYFELTERNKNAKDAFPQYIVFYKDKTSPEDEFKQMEVFGTAKDARQFIDDDYVTKFDSWQIVQIDKNLKETEIYKINC